MNSPEKKAKKQVDQYRTTDVMTSNREKILLMMYDAAIRFLKKAIRGTEEGDAETRTKYVKKTQDIVNELRSTLNFKVGGDIAKHLDRLYDYVSVRLTRGNLDKNPKAFQEALSVLETLQSGWQSAIDQLKRERTEPTSSK